MSFEYNREKYIRVQRLMNTKTAKAFRTTSSEALCILAGTTPIIIRMEEAVKQYFLRKINGALAQSIYLEVERKNWPHPADVVAFIEMKEYDEKTMQIYTDGSKNEQGVGAGVAIFSGKELVSKLKYKLDNRCSNNQAKQLAIAKALEALETTDNEENSPRTAAIITDSRISLDSIKNVNIHSYQIEEIGRGYLNWRDPTGQLHFPGSRPMQESSETNWLIMWPKQQRGPKIRQPPTAQYL
jgi:hypothetical protein